MVQNLKHKIKSGKIVTGTWNIISNDTIVELISGSGFDFIILDMEHGSFNFTELGSAIRCAQLHNCATLIRVPGLDYNSTQRALDLGADGIIYPQVNSFEEAQKAVSFTKYPPNGTRGFNPFTRAGNYGKTIQTSHTLAPEEIWSSVIIENKSAYDQIDKILEIPDLDLVYLGAYDMSVALGCPGEMNNKELISFIENGVTKIRAANKVAGIMGGPPEATQRYISMGANLIAVGVDSYLIGKSLQDLKSSYNTLIEGSKK